jgi:hypothetical protein
VDIDSKNEISIGSSDHADDYFVELCALSATGTLSPAEWSQLNAHLAHCARCRTIKEEYDKILSTTLPAMAANHLQANDGNSPDPWDIEAAEAALLERIERENIEPDMIARSPESSSRSRSPLIIGAVAAALLLSCSYAAYRAGEVRGHHPLSIAHLTERAVAVPQAEAPRLSPPLRHQSKQADPELVARLTEFRNRLQASATETSVLEEQRQSLTDQLTHSESELKEIQGLRADLEQRLSLAQTTAQTLQAKLGASAAQSLPKPSLEALQQRVTDLTGELDERDRQLAKEEELLEHDHDIRNLMGARDLYIGEIYDVAKSGETQKPFGRVFYTQGKSLVFYAYDLDQQPGVKLASTFQAWGRRGIDQQHDVSLGIFYQDEQNKRWVLKSNDSATLSRLDAVFVTVEPHGESSKPTGKPLLFTYLKLPPNHP